MYFRIKDHRLAKVFVFAIVIFLGACSTKKTAFVNRVYHGITTRYNIYFNGHESFKEAEVSLNKELRDNYTNILPVFIYPEKTVAMSFSPQWDRTIEKCSKAITKHSILVKGEEYCRPIDDTYLLMGKAYFYRQDYNDALRIFSYIINTHQNGNVWADAYTWKAKTNLQLNRIDDAEEGLEQIRQTIMRHKNKKYKQHWEAVIADKLLRQKEYDLAAAHLAEIEGAKFIDRDFKTRVLFILGQIYQKLEQPELAQKKYEKVLKRNPPYEMEFNATLNMLLCASNVKRESKSTLKKMLKDIRNEEYKDQIFYVLAKIDFKNEDTISAIRNLEASVFWSINNQYQKTVSALELAEYYFEHSLFMESQQYYDTVLSIIPPSFPNFEEIRVRAGVLKNLVENLMIIKTQDSLQRMAAMSAEELDLYIDKIIADYEQKEADRIADEAEKAQMMENTSRSNTSSRKSAWVFYNTTQSKLGEQEFRQKWGRRVLEDNWFISDKTNMMFMTENLTEEMGETTEDAEEKPEKEVPQGSRINDPTNKQYYKQDIPKSETDIVQSNELIVIALYNAGFIYFDNLNDKEKAVQQWESLLSRYPNHKLEAPTAFQLYKAYTLLNNTEKSEYYKNLVLSKYPESDFAKIIENPNYYAEIEAKKKESQSFYANVFTLFEEGKYNQVVSETKKGLELYLDPGIRKNMSYLRAVSLGKLNGDEVFKKELQSVVQSYPATDIDTLASGVLEALKRLEFEKNNASPIAADSSKILKAEIDPYVYKDANFHFIIIVADIKEIKVDKLRLSISNFNKEYFRMEKFDISNFYIDNTQQMITISRFENKQKAMEYYWAMKNNQTHFDELNKAKRTIIYVISDDNYTIFFRNKDRRMEYDDFFNKYYLDK
ncbi:MAG: tetratricopeptide repeat protein [Bacteroidales bacterium]|nr:tetratricopeptide repeat protein [Bacteroidales bacterium]